MVTDNSLKTLELKHFGVLANCSLYVAEETQSETFHITSSHLI